MLRYDIKTIILSVLMGVLLVMSIIYVKWIYNPSQSSAIVCMGLLCVLIGVYCGVTLRKSAYRFSIIDLFVVIVSIVFCASYIKYPSLPAIGNLCLPILYCGIRLQSKIHWIIIYWSILITLAGLFVYGYLQYFMLIPTHNAEFPVTGPYHNPAIYAGTMAILYSVLLSVINVRFYGRRCKWIIRLSVVIGVIGLPVLMLTESRAAWVALCLSTTYLLYYRFHILLRDFVRKYCKFLFVGIPVFILFLGIVLYQYKPQSADGRILIWKVSFQMLKEKPFTGFGVNGFPSHYMYYQAAYLKAGGTSDEKYLAGNTHLTFNEPLRLTVEYGILGLAFYMVFISYIMKLRSRDIVALSSLSVLIVVIVWGLFAYPFHVFPIMVFATIALACLVNRSQKRVLVVNSQSTMQRLIKSLLFVFSVGIFLMMAYTLPAYKKMNSLNYRAGTFSETEIIDEMESVGKRIKGESGYWYLYCFILKQQENDSLLREKIAITETIFPTPTLFLMKGDMQQRFGEYTAAESSYKLAHYMMPSLQLARGRLALMYYKQDRIDEALSLAEELLQEKVKNYGFHTHELHLELQKTFEGKLNKCLTKKQRTW